MPMGTEETHMFKEDYVVRKVVIPLLPTHPLHPLLSVNKLLFLTSTPRENSIILRKWPGVRSWKTYWRKRN